MPVRRDREPVYVLIRTRAGGPITLGYGFNSGADSGTRSALGQVDITSALPTGGLVFGANLPKPARMSKETGTAVETSFCGTTEIASARTAGYRLATPAKYATARSGRKQVAVYVETNGQDEAASPKVKYAWMMDKTDFAAFGADLGIKQVATNDDVVFGASRPKPANVFKVAAGKTTGSFIADKDYETVLGAGAGWNKRKPAIPVFKG